MAAAVKALPLHHLPRDAQPSRIKWHQDSNKGDLVLRQVNSNSSSLKLGLRVLANSSNADERVSEGVT